MQKQSVVIAARPSDKSVPTKTIKFDSNVMPADIIEAIRKELKGEVVTPEPHSPLDNPALNRVLVVVSKFLGNQYVTSESVSIFGLTPKHIIRTCRNIFDE